MWQLGSALAEMIQGQPVFIAGAPGGRTPSAAAAVVHHVGRVPRSVVDSLGWSVPVEWQVADESEQHRTTSLQYQAWVAHTPFIGKCLSYRPCNRPLTRCFTWDPTGRVVEQPLSDSD